MEKRALDQKDPVFIYCLGLFLGLLGGIILQTFGDSESNGYIYISYLLPQIGYIVGIFGYSFLARINLDFRLKENVTKEPTRFIWAIILGFGVFFFGLLPNFGLVKLCAFLDKELTVTLPSLVTTKDFILATIFLCIIPSIVEELFFRKTIVDGIKSIGEINTVLIAGLIFSLSHLNLAQTLHQFVVGCLLAIVYLKTSNILYTIIMHLINNLLAIYLSTASFSYIFDNIYWLIGFFFVGIILICIGLRFILKGKPRLNNINKQKISGAVLGLIACLTFLWVVSALVL